jgi:hypothetical protein
MQELTANQINKIIFVMVDATDTELTGLTVSAFVSKNNAAFAAITNPVTEIGSGWYGTSLTPTECNTPAPLAFRATAPGARQQNIDCMVAIAVTGTNPPPPVSAIAFTYTLTSTVGATPIPGASVWVTTDVGGANTVAQGTTDALGVVVFNLQPATYYFWRAASEFGGTNPQTIVVS